MATLDLEKALNSLTQSPYQDGNTSQYLGDLRRDRQLLYWRRCSGCASHSEDLGFLMIGPYPNRFSLAEVQEFTASKHAQQLSVEYIKPAPGSNRHPVDELTNPDTRWFPLLRNGGIREMPVEQMAQFGWHRIPKIVEEVPELKKVKEIYCEHGCPTTGPQARWFLTPQGYQDHVTVIHSNVAVPKAIGDTIAKAMEAQAAQSNTFTPEVLAEIMQQMGGAIAAALANALQPQIKPEK